MKIKTKDDRREPHPAAAAQTDFRHPERPRLSVFRSVTHIYAQVIDDMSGKTLVSASSVEPSVKGHVRAGRARRQREGRRGHWAVIATRSIEKGITRVVFDRSGFLYHGRIRAVADAARKAGLEF